MTLRRLHRVLAALLSVFIVMHLANHLALFLGPDQHLRVQKVIQPIYRNPVIEPALFAAFCVQIFTGGRMLLRRGWPKTALQRVQVASGALFGLFVVQHVSAALMTRAFKPEVDTTVFWAASVVSRPAFAAYFAPYYAIGVAALFVHVAVYVAIRHRRPALAYVIGAAGIIWAATLVAALARVPLPAVYETYLDNFWF